MFGGDPEDFPAYHLSRLIHGIAGNHGPSARESAGAPIELIGVAGHHIDVADIDTDLSRGNLSKAGEMTLALGADAGRNAHLPICLNLHFRALIRPNAGPLDTAGYRHAEVAPLGAQSRLLIADETRVVDCGERLIQHRLVIAAVIFERSEVLINNLVVVRERIRRYEVSAPNFDAIDSQLARGEIEQSLNDEYAVLAAGATVRRDDRQTGEYRGEGAVVARHHIWPE